jgi:hypothetical protein
MYPHFSSFADPHALEGGKVKIGDVLDKEILIVNYRITPSNKNSGQCLTIQFELNREKHVIFTGSSVLKNQLEKYKDKLPFLASIVK